MLKAKNNSQCTSFTARRNIGGGAAAGSGGGGEKRSLKK